MSFLNFFKPKARIVTIMPAGVSFEVPSGQSILEAGLAQGFAMPHSCTVGTCGECKCKKEEGTVREMNNFAYVLTAEELQTDVIITCQAAPKSDVTITIPHFELKRLQPPKDFTGQITEISDLTHDTKKVSINLDAEMKFDAGQYVQVSIDSVEGARSYSFAMPPKEGGNDSIDLFIRKVEGGEFTEKLFSGALNNAVVSVHGPNGNFWLRGGRSPIICVGGGSGLAPIISLLEQAAKTLHGRPCVFFYGARTQDDLYCMDRIKEIEQKWDGAFKFVPVLSDVSSDSHWQGLTGYVNTVIDDIAGEYINADTQVYLCGPPPMIDAVTETVISLGIEPSNVHADKFLDASHGLTR